MNKDDTYVRGRGGAKTLQIVKDLAPLGIEMFSNGCIKIQSLFQNIFITEMFSGPKDKDLDRKSVFKYCSQTFIFIDFLEQSAI